MQPHKYTQGSDEDLGGLRLNIYSRYFCVYTAYVCDVRGIFVSCPLVFSSWRKQHDFISARGSSPQITVNRVCVFKPSSMHMYTTVGCAAVCVCYMCL